MIDFTALKEGLKPPADKNKLVAIMARGINLPAAARTLAYIAIQRMSQQEIDAIAALALHAIGYLEREDLDGLKAFLGECKIPAEISEIIVNGAKNLARQNAENKAGE